MSEGLFPWHLAGREAQRRAVTIVGRGVDEQRNRH